MKFERIVAFFKSNTSYAITFVWSLAEGLFFFIVPDVYVGIASVFVPKTMARNLVISIAGSLVSALIIRGLVVSHVAGEQLLLLVPGISVGMIDDVRAQFMQFGTIAVTYGPLSGIPYKIFSAEAALLQLPLLPYLFWSIISRLTRLLPVALVGFVIGTFFKQKIQRYWTGVFAAYAMLWIVVYVFYFTNVIMPLAK